MSVLLFNDRIKIMNVAIEAIPSEDTSLFTYMLFEYDKEFFNDIYENLTEISKDNPLTFNLKQGYFTVIQGSYETVRKKISIANVEAEKYSKTDAKFNPSAYVFPLDYCQVHIDRNYFYFTAYTFKNRKKLEFQSINFDKIFLEKIRAKNS